MRKLHKKPLIMAAATLALTGTLAVGSAMAYFTTYSTAGGGVKMNMGFTETIPNETVDQNGKHVTISNIGIRSGNTYIQHSGRRMDRNGRRE